MAGGPRGQMDQVSDDIDDPFLSHRRPDGVSDDTVRALGVVSKALETTERARGALYTFHQLTGTADAALDEAVALLRRAGHTAQADVLEREIVGRNVIPDHWTFQVVEAYDRTYYRPFQEVERRLRDELAEGRDHLHEAEMKQARRTEDHPDHTLGE